ncbi:NAD(P)H dehydrogenase (quinone) [Sphingobacterium paludis]|uniref:NAD(P)H dehydrogenase (Quinone) n=2 Tax=Sphingobacterium paludis TaxID=1476465 RepID=A0A4R7CT56_9SPHI|nr:NAD(P)H dehydrogenase (quinone) [Sphingobacterium paludis]
MAQEYGTKVLILFHSDNGGTYELAKEVAKGIENDKKVRAVIKQVKASTNPKLKDVPIASVEELATYDGIAFGSPVYFGNISTAMIEFIAKTIDLWSKHALEGKPATVFMSAGSGAGKELALQAFWNTLAVHGMVLVSNGISGYENIDKNIPQGNSVLGTTSLASLKSVERPSKSERYLAELQGKNFAKVAFALGGTKSSEPIKSSNIVENTTDINQVLKQKNIILPALPKAVGNYELFVRSGNLVFINQVALKDGKIFNPGKVGIDVTEEQVKEATKVTMLNIIAILKEATGGDLNRVKRCVQLIGTFNTNDTYTNHAALMNAASDLTVEIFGEKGKHTRNTSGAYSLPVGSSVGIQAIFEIE